MRRSDIYSVGAVGYFLLTGRRRSSATRAVQVLLAHVNDAPAPPSSAGPTCPRTSTPCCCAAWRRHRTIAYATPRSSTRRWPNASPRAAGRRCRRGGVVGVIGPGA